MKDVKCKLCVNYKNEWCSKIFDSPDPDMLRDCGCFSHMTNADRIRAMTDEELAEMRTDILVDVIEKIAEHCKLNVNYSVEQLKESYLEWLKQKVEE